MDLNLLSVFITVVNEGSLSAAARKLDLPVSSVSRTIARLEEQLNTPLLLRTTRRISKTAAGEALFQSVAPLVSTLESELERLGERSEEPSGELRITAPVELGPAFLADALSHFMLRYPDISVFAHMTNQVLDLVKEGFDFGLRMTVTTLKDSSLVAKKASPLVGHIYASPNYLARRGTPKMPADFRGHDWVVFSRTPKVLELQTSEGKVNVTPKGRIATTDILFVRELVRAGVGIGFLPSFLAESDVSEGTLVRVCPKATAFTGNLWLVRPNMRHVPLKVAVFRDFILEYLKTRPLAS